MISAIVAVDENWGIGFNGELLEKIPEDMKFFKDLTIGNKNNVVVMGKKTFNSIGKCLPYRENVIISHHGFNNAEFDIRGSMSYWNENYTQTFCRLEIFQKKIANKFYDKAYDDVFIIGGGQIYKELLPLCDRVYVTKIFKSHDNVDTFFPNLDEPEEWNTWKAVHQSETKVYNDIMYQFWIYDRIN